MIWHRAQGGGEALLAVGGTRASERTENFQIWVVEIERPVRRHIKMQA
jgi:hypothetical protein